MKFLCSIYGTKLFAGENVVIGQTSTHGEGSKTYGTNAGLGDRTTHAEVGRETDGSYVKEGGSNVIAH
jgi:hypothetical protein